MKRDMDLVREILLFAERECKAAFFPTVTGDNFHGYSTELVVETVELLEEAGYLRPMRYPSHDAACLKGVTWLGHEYLDKVRDPEVWRKTKEIAAKAGGGGIDVMSQIASSVISTAIAAALKIQGN
jgi:hypothetical protein